MGRKRFNRRRSGGRVNDLLDQASGRGGSRRDKRPEKGSTTGWKGAKTLDVKRDAELFDGLVTLDFDFLMNQNFAAAGRNLADLLCQSVLGRAQNGHGWFTDEFGSSLRFPEATFERILTVLERSDPNLKPHLVRRRRGDMLQGFGQWLLERSDQPELELVIDGAPVFGVDFLAAAKVNTREFLTGLVLAGFMDDWSYRETSMFQYKRNFGGLPYHVGGGEILIVDRANFEMCGLGDTGGTLFLDDDLRTLRDIGVICRNRHARYAFPTHDQAFFRRRLGEGVCDDLAMIWVGAKYGYSAMLGAFVMDAIDTYDKYLLDLTWGGYDTALAGLVQKQFRQREEEPLVCDSAICELIHFAAKNNHPTVFLSSSHRRFIQVEKQSSVPTLLNHWRFLQGEPVFDIKLGYSQLPAREFYQAAWRRLKSSGLEVAEPTFIKAGPVDRK